MEQNSLKILIGMHRILNHLNRQTASFARREGLTLSQFSVLEVLYSKGDMSVGSVKEKSLSSTGTIPVIVHNLEKAGYIERYPHEKDRRISLLCLTEAGRKKVVSILPKNVEMIEKEMQGLSEEEKEKFLFLLKKLGGRSDAKESS